MLNRDKSTHNSTGQSSNVSQPGSTTLAIETAFTASRQLPNNIGPPLPSGDTGHYVPVTVLIGAVVGTLSVLFAVAACVYVWRRMRERSKRLPMTLGSILPRPSPTGWSSAEGEHAPQDASDEFTIHASDLIINDDHQIGCGAFARVFLGELRRTKVDVCSVQRIRSKSWSRVAVKQARLPTDEARHDMQRELDLMKDVGRHTHVVSLVGYVPLFPPLIVLEYCANGDLLTYLRAHLQQHKDAVVSINEELQTRAYANTSVTLKDLLSLCWQIADGMTFLSAKGYVHRDLAARNVLLTGEMVAKIADFGLCRFTNEDLYVTMHGGKLPIRWMAPETLTTANFSTASDVWSYGVLLYEVFSAGIVPYVGVHPEDILQFLHNGHRLEQPQLCPVEIYDLMMECWRQTSTDRPTFDHIRGYFSVRLDYVSQGYGYLFLEADSELK